MVFWFRDVPSSAALPVIRPALGRQHSMSDRAKVAMQQYLNHFLGNLDIVNSREVWLDSASFYTSEIYSAVVVNMFFTVINVCCRFVSFWRFPSFHSRQNMGPS